MNTFSSIKLKINWKQAMLYEMAIISLGIFIGSTWPNIFTGMIRWVLLLIFIIAGGYVSILWINQNKDKLKK